MNMWINKTFVCLGLTDAIYNNDGNCATQGWAVFFNHALSNTNVPGPVVLSLHIKKT